VILLFSRIICKRLGLSSGHFPSGFPTKTLYTAQLSPIRAMCHATHGTTRVTTHTCYSIAATTPVLTNEILNSVF